jgi:hypothetical protein
MLACSVGPVRTVATRQAKAGAADDAFGTTEGNSENITWQRHSPNKKINK